MSFGHFVEVMWDVNVFFFKEPIVGINALTIFLGLFHFLFYNWLTIGLDIPDVLVALDNIPVLIMLYSSTPEEFSDICYRSTGNKYKQILESRSFSIALV